MKITSKSSRIARDIFKSITRLDLRADSDDDEKFLSDLHRVLVAGSTTRRDFALQVADLRAKLDGPPREPSVNCEHCGAFIVLERRCKCCGEAVCFTCITKGVKVERAVKP